MAQKVWNVERHISVDGSIRMFTANNATALTPPVPYLLEEVLNNSRYLLMLDS